MPHQRIFILLLVSWYLALALGHYLNQRPLWNDEQCVNDNIVQQKPLDLFTKPLLRDQAFPRVYLWAIQQFSNPFHQHVLALRFFPLIAMLAAFFIWLIIAKTVLSRAWELLLFIGSWAASMPLVYYAAELKPYSMDVLASGVIVLFLIRQDQIAKNTKIYPLVLFFIPLLGLCSYPVLFLLILPLYNLIRGTLHDRRSITSLLIYLSGCIAVLCLVYYLDFRVSVHSLLEEFWHDYFISVDSLSHFLKSFGHGMHNLVARPLAENPKWVKLPSALFIGAGIVYMLGVMISALRKDLYFLRSVIPITAFIFFIQLILAMARVYPLGVPRMEIFLTPLLVLMAIKAMGLISESQQMPGKCLRLIAAVYLIFLSMGIAWDVLVFKDLGAQSKLYALH